MKNYDIQSSTLTVDESVKQRQKKQRQKQMESVKTITKSRLKPSTVKRTANRETNCTSYPEEDNVVYDIEVCPHNIIVQQYFSLYVYFRV